MRKGWIVTLIIFLLFVGIVFGILSYNKNKTEDINMIDNKQLAEENIEKNIIPTAMLEEKVSPNAKILKKIYFTGCDHLIKESLEIPQQLVNKDKEEVKKYYNEWNVDSFSSDEITIYKEESGFCNQHYIVKEHNGVLAIYTQDENGQLTFKKDTEIQTMYLPETDLERVKQGIEVIGDMELNSVIGDYE